MDTTHWYKDWFNSPYYHLLYAGRDEQEAAHFIDTLIGYLKPPAGATMLDIACGKGRHSIQLADKGFDVTGIDLSEESICQALHHERENLHFYRHDMRLPFRINYYDYAFNFFTSFGYFETDREHHNAIRTIADSLRHNGCFVMDFLNVHYAENTLVPETEMTIQDIRFYITKWFDDKHFYKKIIVEDDRLEGHLEYTEKVAKFTLGDLTEMFALNGLQVREIFGDYSFAPYDNWKSPRLILVANKR